ncbi:MAG: sigma-54 dependent transcriptional regulator [Bacteroidales bacterium]|nr:sigma-54 dependent transcriptional regulator [Bacteroidales bacterium]
MDTLDLQRLKTKYDIIGDDPALNRALETAVAVAPYDLPVLITGESGVGKEVFPKIIHQLGRRRNGKLLAVNCGAIPPGTVNAELFGHEKGSFTGAVVERKGYFEEADGGTIFLDEIGELPKDTQALLLRVLENGEFIKVGSSKPEKTNVRIVAATNVDLSHAVATGKFRRDLYHRLNGIQIKMPSLRERPQDILLLFRKFSSDFAERYNLCRLALTHDAVALLTAYRWPGNIRELKNMAETVTAMESDQATPASTRVEIGPEELGRYIPDEHDSLLPATVQMTGAQGQPVFDDQDKQMIVKAILDLKNEVDSLHREIDILKSRNHTSVLDRPEKPRIVEIDKHDYDEQPQFKEEPQGSPKTIREEADERILECLKRHGGSVKDAAIELGLSQRTIYRKMATLKNKK